LGATYWLNQQVLPEPTKPDSQNRHDPDAIIENFTATKLDEQGAPNFIMAATQMLHYPDDDSTSLEMPRVTMLSAEQPTIHAVAKHGDISSKGDVIILHGDVEVLRESSAKLSGLTLQTDYLRIIPDQDLINTNRPVVVVDAHNIFHATGLEMDNKTRTLKLLSQVRSEHVPNTP
jgi:lipopolysaccharide export system protein LptC